MAQTPFCIRRLTASDAANYRAVRLRALKEHPEAFLISHREESRGNVAAFRKRLRDGCVLGAFVGEILAGTVGIHRESLEKIRHKALIWGMYVTEEYRGTGMARALMEAALKFIRGMRGVEQVRLDVGARNRAARKLYLSVGFRGFGVEKRAMKLGQRSVDEEMMVCFLGKSRG